jgi:hypothetical protein
MQAAPPKQQQQRRRRRRRRQQQQRRQRAHAPGSGCASGTRPGTRVSCACRAQTRRTTGGACPPLWSTCGVRCVVCVVWCVLCVRGGAVRPRWCMLVRVGVCVCVCVCVRVGGCVAVCLAATLAACAIRQAAQARQLPRCTTHHSSLASWLLLLGRRWPRSRFTARAWSSRCQDRRHAACSTQHAGAGAGAAAAAAAAWDVVRVQGLRRPLAAHMSRPHSAVAPSPATTTPPPHTHTHTHLLVGVVRDAQAAGADVADSGAADHAHNLGRAAAVVAHRQHMAHARGQLAQPGCGVCGCGVRAERGRVREWDNGCARRSSACRLVEGPNAG